MRSSLLVVALVAVSACSSGGGDLNHLEERPKPLDNPIAKAAAPETRTPDGQTIRARGVVVIAVDNYDDNGAGAVGDIYVQDPVQTGPKGTAWSGLRLYRPSKNPPDLELAAGQGVDLVGEFVAFLGPPTSPFRDRVPVPQVSNASLTLTYESTPPPPVDITPADLADTATGMQYASRLVRMKNVVLMTDFTGSRPEAQIYDTSGRLILGAKLFPLHKVDALKKGVTVKSITGVLDYFYNFKLCPRSIADVEL
jgi:hypothetical protein